MLRQGAQHALLLCAEACWLAPNTMPFGTLLHAVLAGAVLPVRRLARGVRVAARGTGGARGAAVGQPRGACAPRKLLDRRLHCERGRRYSNFPLPIKSARPLLFSRRNLGLILESLIKKNSKLNFAG